MAKEFWSRVQKDMQKGYKDSLSFLKSKTEQITEESKKKYKIYEHKHKAHKQLAELGATVYGLVTTGGSVDDSDKVKATVEKIRKIEEQIAKMEAQTTTKTPAIKKAAAKKKTAAPKKKAATKKKAAPVKKTK